MDIKDYSKKALRTDYRDYSDFHTGEATPRLDYAAIGLTTSAAKILNILKKTKKNLKPLDRIAAKEELGDLLWYLNLTTDELGLTFEEIMESNIKKIDTKYPANDPSVSKIIRG